MVTEESYNPVMRAHARAYAVIQSIRHHPSPALKNGGFPPILFNPQVGWKKRPLLDQLNAGSLPTSALGAALRLQRHKGAAQCEQGPGQYLTWEIAR